METKYQKHDVEEKLMEKWQRSLDIVAQLFEVPSALIMRVHSRQIEVLVSSASDGNPYKQGEKESLESGLYCETVMRTNEQLIVSNALEDENWKDNPDVSLGMIAYLGIPLIWPDGEVFGTICVLDTKTRHFSNLYQSLLWEIKEIIESDFKMCRQYISAINAKQNLFQTIFDNAPAIMMLISEKMEAMTVNQAGLSMANETIDKVVGVRPGDILKCVNAATHPEGCGFGNECKSCGVRQIVERTIADNQNFFKVETALNLKVGETVRPKTVLISSSVIPDADPKMVLLTIDDITSRKHTERALYRWEERYRTIMEGMQDAIYICSPDFKIEYMNQAMVSRLGRNAVGELCYEALHNLDKKCRWCVHDKVTSGHCIRNEVQSPLDNRSYFVSHSPISNMDGTVSKLSVYRDVSEFKKLGQQLQQAQKMEALGALAGGIAHDFNNILFPILGYAEILFDDSSTKDPQYRYVEEIVKGAKRAGELIDQILTFSRQKEQQVTQLKPELIVKEVIKLMRATLPTTIRIEKYIDPYCMKIEGDPTQLHQITMNLITNAYHAMEEEGGVLTVKLQNNEGPFTGFQADSDFQGPGVVLTVSDTGTGIGEDIIDRIFDPYFTTKGDEKGTGLGLSVVHGIVKNYGGFIKVDSTPGEGTTFDVCFPAIADDGYPELQQSAGPAPGGSERILLVDDDNQVLEFENQMLKLLGYDVVAERESLKALERIRNGPGSFDLVITDMTMPYMTGEVLAKKILEIVPGMPVIICTGYSEKIDKEKSEKIGIKAFLSKPMSKSDFTRAIRDVLDRAEQEGTGRQRG